MSDEREQGGAAMGFFVGALVGFVLCVPAGWFVVSRMGHDAVEGWTLKPIVVATEDLPPGTVITYEVLSQRPIPEKSVGPSMVPPDAAASIVGQKLLAPTRAGEPLTFQQFGQSPRR